MQETFLKYLAGLLDADGALSFQFAETTTSRCGVYLRLVLTAAESVDKDGQFIKSLPFGSVVTTEIAGWSKRNDWVVTKRSELEQLLPRLVKHMVVKGAHWKRMYDAWVALRGRTVSSQGADELRTWSKTSRSKAGPVKPRNHPSWAWVAGYLDGDGSYQNRYCPNKKYRAMRVSCTAHVNDRIGLELLQKAFGGNISEIKGTNIVRWWRGLGYANSSFATRFLSKIVHHSRLKKHQVEAILANHSQRLTVSLSANSPEKL